MAAGGTRARSDPLDLPALPRATPATTRLQLRTFWEVVFLLKAVLFLLIGQQVPHVRDGIGGGLSLGAGRGSRRR